MNRFFLACIMLISTSILYSQIQIKPNEKLSYSASYQLSGFMTDIAQVTMSTETVTTSKNSFLHLHCEAKTYSSFESIFKVEDFFDSYVDPITLRPSLYKRNTSEGDFTKVEKYVFAHDGKSITSTASKKKRPETKRTIAIGSSTVDIVSVIYKLRTIDLSNMKAGQTKSFTIVFDEKEVPIAVKMLGKENVSSTLGSKECFKLSIAAKTDVLKGTDKNLIWITNDDARIPTLIKFSIPVGTGQLKLTNVSN